MTVISGHILKSELALCRELDSVNVSIRSGAQEFGLSYSVSAVQ